MPNDDEKFGAIIKRLDTIISILMKQNQFQEMNMREQILALAEIGLRDSEIAGILGRSRGYVAGEKSKMKSKGESNG
jgi:DNA-binding CsgD family transcriptional regulator